MSLKKISLIAKAIIHEIMLVVSTKVNKEVLQCQNERLVKMESDVITRHQSMSPM